MKGKENNTKYYKRERRFSSFHKNQHESNQRFQPQTIATTLLPKYVKCTTINGNNLSFPKVPFELGTWPREAFNVVVYQQDIQVVLFLVQGISNGIIFDWLSYAPLHSSMNTSKTL